MKIQTNIDNELDERTSEDVDCRNPKVHIRQQYRLTGEPGSARRRWVILCASALCFIAIAFYVLIRPTKSAADPASEQVTPVVSVKVAKAEKREIASEITALGTVFPQEQAQVSSKISAQIRKMPLLKNRVVHAGEVIASLESRDLESQRGEAVAALGETRASARGVETGTIPQTNAQDQKALRDAQAATSNARAVYDRRLALFQKDGISKKDVETSKLDLSKAEGDLRLAEQTITLRAAINLNDRAQAAARVNQATQRLGSVDTQLSYATVRAPFSGVVTEQTLYEGSFVTAGAPLVTIANINQVIVKAQFADTVSAELKTGDPVEVTPTDTPGDPMHGQISLISRALDPTNRTVEVWVTLANDAGRLRANGSVHVTVSTNAKDQAIVVPASAVTLDATSADEGTVMVVDALNVAHETKVKVGIRAGDQIEIVSGLEGGETVVIEGNYALPDGTRVEPADDKGATEPDEK
jgi:multidrug efflux pump subunit AcrA (membrane-fusion protein)